MTITINNRKINLKHIKTGEQQPTIVFLHDSIGSVAQWRDFPEKISQAIGFNVLVFDRFGHGLSDGMTESRGKDYLHIEAYETTPSVLQHFNIQNPILFGHSDGGTIALLYAAHYPTKALIIESAHVLVDSQTLKGIAQAEKNKDFIVDRLKKYHGDKSKALFEAWTQTWQANFFQDWNITSILSRISCPALIMQGANDEYALPQHLDWIVNGMGDKAVKWLIPNCKHTPHREQEDLILNKTVEFVKSVTINKNLIKS